MRFVIQDLERCDRFRQTAAVNQWVAVHHQHAAVVGDKATSDTEEEVLLIGTTVDTVQPRKQDVVGQWKSFIGFLYFKVISCCASEYVVGSKRK